MVCLADECGDIIMQLLQRGLMHIDHVTGLIEFVLDIGLELSRHRQLQHLVDALVIWCGQIEIADVKLDPQLRIVLHRPGQIGHHVGMSQRPGEIRRLMLMIPYRT